MTQRIVIASRIAISAQFAALIRCLAQFFWLRHAFGTSLSSAQVQPFILGAFVTALFLVSTVFLSFANQHRAVFAIATVNVVVLLALKFWFL